MAVAGAARWLVALRERWLNPPEWVEWEDEPAPGYPRRPVPRDEAAAQALKDRTLTKLYNARPKWLEDAHAALDEAVATAYGWPASIAEEDALERLLALNSLVVTAAIPLWPCRPVLLVPAPVGRRPAWLTVPVACRACGGARPSLRIPYGERGLVKEGRDARVPKGASREIRLDCVDDGVSRVPAVS